MKGIPCLKELALRGGHGDAEISRVGRGQGGDVARHLALAHGAKALMGFVHQLAHHGLGGQMACRNPGRHD